MRVKRFILSLMLIFMAFNGKVYAFPADSNKNESEVQIDRVEEIYKNITNSLDNELLQDNKLIKSINIRDFLNNHMKTGKSNLNINVIASELLKYSLKEFLKSLEPLGMIMVIAIICSLLNNLQQAFSNEKLSNIAFFACYSVIIVLLTGIFFSGVKICKETINSMKNFMTALVPVLITILSGSGAVAEASVLDPIIIFFINISAKLYVNFIIPIIFVSFVLQFVNNISSEFKVEKLCKFLNKGTVWAQGIMVTILIGVITVRGTTSKTLDQVAVKTAKYAVDNFVPLVGKSLSDAIATVASYSILLKSAVSTLGLIILVLLVIYPIIKILILSLMFKFSAAIIEPISDKKIVNCLTSAGSSLTLVLSCVISMSVMFYVMIAMIGSAGKAMIGG